MKRQAKVFILVSAALLMLACRLVDITADSSQKDCEAKGGSWKPLAKSDGSVEYYCEMTVYEEGKPCTADPSQVWSASKVVRDTTNEFGTRICDYNIKFISNKPEQVWIVTYQHEADVWAKTDEKSWTVHRLEGAVENPLDLDADEFYSSIELAGWYNYYNDKDAVGPTMLVYEEYAAILDTPDCASLREDEAYLQLVAVPIEPACKP